MTTSKDIRHQIHVAGLWEKVFCFFLLSDTLKNINKQKKSKHKDPKFFFVFFPLLPPRHKQFQTLIVYIVTKRSSSDVNVERCKRCVSSSRFGLEQVVDPVSDCVRKASHGCRQAKWRDEVVHKRTDGEDNWAASGASPRLNRGQGQCTVLAI